MIPSRTTTTRVCTLLVGGAVLLSGCGHSAIRHSSTGRSHVTRTRTTSGNRRIPSCSVSQLPAEVPSVIAAINAGGPFKHPRNDGVVFNNYQRALPQRQSGFYREYTVDTPGASTRGTRRIIKGSVSPTGPGLWYYTGDHYASFCQITDAATTGGSASNG